MENISKQIAYLRGLMDGLDYDDSSKEGRIFEGILNVLDEIDACAKALTAQKIKAGDRVTICLPNVPQAVIMFYAINKIGAVASMVHPLSAENE